jgi:hypothetical protein
VVQVDLQLRLGFVSGRESTQRCRTARSLRWSASVDAFPVLVRLVQQQEVGER